MKIEYTCETCGKRFNTAHEAKRCEAAHEIEAKRDALKCKSTELISGLIEKHIRDFRELPDIYISDATMAFLEDKRLGVGFSDLLNLLLGSEDEEDDEDEEEEEE